MAGHQTALKIEIWKPQTHVTQTGPPPMLQILALKSEWKNPVKNHKM